MRTSTETLIAAMHILATEIQSDDGAANAAVAEAAERLAEQHMRITQLERENNATNAEIRSLQYNIDRVMGMYAAKDNQICNLLNICRANGIDVSSQDLIHWKESK